MAGHSHWKQIKEQKGTADRKRAQLFSKLLAAIAVAAKSDSNPQFNPRLKAAIEKARENHVPSENIERAVNRPPERNGLEEVMIEAYGPEKAALIIEAITDNKNRTLAEIRRILTERGAKAGERGSAAWAFEKTEAGWSAKFPQEISSAGWTKIKELIAALEALSDVQGVVSNAVTRAAP